MNKAIGLVLILLMAVPVMAELSAEYKEWGTGPAQWIMTPEEQRAWRKIATDDEAIAFIDLFWVRRDPTVGTAVNEYRREFESRVAFSDQEFTEKRKRGAMTDRGRVYIVLGAGTTMEGVVGQSLAQMGAAETNSDSFGQAGMTYLWTWEHADARKFDMPRIVVGFVQDSITKKVQRDPRRPDFGRAGPKAIAMAIVNPGLTAVPEWAATGGLKPVAHVTYTETVLEPAPAPAEPAPNEGPAVASTTPGISRLTLMQRGAINARSATDPFVATESTFGAGLDVIWAAQFCSASATVPRLKYMLHISGPSEQRTKEKDAKPERMTALPGCYVLQGKAPVANLAPGKYKLTVYIDSASGESYTVKQEFRLEK